jgi:hypothetical protein
LRADVARQGRVSGVSGCVFRSVRRSDAVEPSEEERCDDGDGAGGLEGVPVEVCPGHRACGFPEKAVSTTHRSSPP